MYTTDVGVCAVFIMVLEWSFTSADQNFGVMNIQEFDHLGYVLEITRNPVTTEMTTETFSESEEVGIVYCYT